MKYFCPHRNEYFFNRHRESFASILFFYQSSGKLCRPGDINLKVFIEECEFFQLPEWAISFMKRKEGFFLEEEIFNLVKAQPIEILTFRSKVWHLLQDPSSSQGAQLLAWFNVCLLFICIVINCLKTLKEVRPTLGNVHTHDWWELTDIIINTYFLIEFILRFIISPNKLNFFKELSAWIDFIALITFIPMVNKHYANESLLLIFTPFQLIRIIRIFRLTKMIPGFNFAVIIIKNSVPDLKNFMSCLLFLSATGSTLLYSLEHHEKDTSFTSIPISMYWAVQTFVTLGYGDMVPTTALGKLLATCFMICFIPTLSIPVVSMFVKFSKFYDFFSAIKE